MDEHERDYLLRHIQGLERANRRWKATAIAALAALALVVLLGVGSTLSFGLLMTRRLQAERARAAAQQAQFRAVQAMALAERQAAAAANQAEQKATKPGH